LRTNSLEPAAADNPVFSAQDDSFSFVLCQLSPVSKKTASGRRRSSAPLLCIPFWYTVVRPAPLFFGTKNLILLRYIFKFCNKFTWIGLLLYLPEYVNQDKIQQKCRKGSILLRIYFFLKKGEKQPICLLDWCVIFLSRFNTQCLTNRLMWRRRTAQPGASLEIVIFANICCRNPSTE
jgi:hypothetical protein